MNTLIIVIIVSLLFSAFFSGMEIAFVSSNKLRLELDKKQNKFYTRITDIFIKNPSNYISTMLVGNNIALVIYGIAFAKLINQPIRDGMGVQSDTLVLLIQTIISTIIVLITGEFLPKTLCRINPNGVLKTFSSIVFFFYILLYPIARFTSWIARILLRLIGKRIDNKRNIHIFNRSDLEQLTSEAANHDEDNDFNHDIQIFQNALEFPDVKVRDCMIPRTEIEAVDISENFNINILKDKFVESGLSRIIVYRENIDNVIGYINSKDLFKKDIKLHSMIRPLQFVPETMQAQKLLKKLIREKQALAIVVDEFGGTSGLISTEDILEEIFGEIEDEHDVDELVEKQIDKNNFVLSGRLEVEYLNTTFDLEIPESEEYETLAGYILHVNENIPKPKDVVNIGKFKARILRMSGSRIDLVQLTKTKKS